MKDKFFTVLLISSSLLSLSSTQALSSDVKIFSGFQSFLTQILKNQSNSLSSSVETVSSTNPLFRKFGDFKLNTASSRRSTAMAQSTPRSLFSTNSPFGTFKGLNIASSNISTAAPQSAMTLQSPLSAIFAGKNNRFTTLAASTQSAPQAAMFQRASNTFNTVSKNPNLSALSYSYNQKTENRNGVVNESSAYKIQTKDTSGNLTTFQEGPSQLLKKPFFFNLSNFTPINRKPMTIPVVTPQTNSLSNGLERFKPLYQNSLDNAKKSTEKMILRSKVKLVGTTLSLKSQEEIKNLLTNTDQYRTLSTIWPTLNNNQKVENTIDYLFTNPQIISLIHSTLTPDELAIVKDENVRFIQNSHIKLPDNLDEFVSNFETYTRPIFSDDSIDDKII